MNPAPHRAPVATSRFRSARAEDIPAMAALVNHWADQGIMLPRTEKELRESVEDFSVVVREGKIVACGALASYGPELAELRSIAVEHGSQRGGLGKLLLEGLLDKAKAARYPKVFAFTYVPGFFEKLGFRIVPPESLPQKAWKDCRFCSKRNGCDEIAMLRLLA